MRRGLFSGVVCKLRPVVHLSPVVLLLNDACAAHGLISGVSAGVVFASLFTYQVLDAHSA